MANESELRKQMEAAYPVSQWSRTTAADGKWLNKNTIKPLNDRDDFLADAIDGFDAKIQAVSAARAAADTAIEQSFANEATERAAADTSLDTRIDGYRDDLEAHKKLDASTDTFGHLKNDAYKKFNDAATTVETNKDKWDNISTIKVGSTDVIGNNVTITGTKNIDVTADSSTKTITVKTTGTVGNSTTPIYMKSDGTFEACSNIGGTNNFGNAIISIGGDTKKDRNYAGCIYFVNNNTQKTCVIPENKIEDWEAALTTMMNAGVNNFIFRFDGDIETNAGWIGSITIRWPVDAMDYYKMYTINFVPLAKPGVPATDGSEATAKYDCKLQLNGGDNPIVYENANYSWQTYAYYYNIPSFIPVAYPTNPTHSWGSIYPFTNIDDRAKNITIYDDPDTLEFTAYDSTTQAVAGKFTFDWKISDTSHPLHSSTFKYADGSNFPIGGKLKPSYDQMFEARDSFYMNPTWKINANNAKDYGYDDEFEEIAMRCIQEHRAVIHEYIGQVYLSQYTNNGTTYYDLPVDIYGHLGDQYAYIMPIQGTHSYDLKPETTKKYDVANWDITRRQMSFMRGADITKKTGDKDGDNTVKTGGTAKTIYFFTQATY